MTKKLVEDTYGGVNVEGKVVEVISNLQRIVKEVGESAYIEYEYYGYEGIYDLIVKYKREETDQEHKRRLAQEKKALEAKKAAKLSKEEKERKEFERLKKKYG